MYQNVQCAQELQEFCTKSSKDCQLRCVDKIYCSSMSIQFLIFKADFAKNP